MRRDEGSRTAWLTAGFWTLTVAFAYLVLGIPDWWAWVVYAVGGCVLLYFWWRRRRGSLVFGAVCGFFAVSALGVSVVAAFDPIVAPLDSVEGRTVACGSVVHPTPADELTETNDTGRQLSPIPQSALERVCTSRLNTRASDASGVALVGLMLTVRAAGHLSGPSRMAHSVG